MTNYPSIINNFISEAEMKTEPTSICEINESGRIISLLNIPAGFQSDSYLKSMYPQHRVYIYGSRYDGKDVMVYEILKRNPESEKLTGDKYQLVKTYIQL